MKTIQLIPILLASFAFANISYAEENTEHKARQVNVDRLKEQYWRKDENVDVVQNRIYSKAKKIEINVFAGPAAQDPFLQVREVGGSLGYHFNEYFSLHGVAWNYFVSNSSALDQLQKQTSTTTNTNKPKLYYGLEGSGSLIYGKLNLAGKAIVYYDFHILGGAGNTNTESGNNLTFYLGVGQQTYVSKTVAIRLDYRRSYYKENVIEKVDTSRLGRVALTRSSWSDIITLGFTFLVPIM